MQKYGLKKKTFKKSKSKPKKFKRFYKYKYMIKFFRNMNSSYFKNKLAKKFLKWKTKQFLLTRKINQYKKIIFFKYFSKQQKYIVRLCFTRTNIFFLCTTFWGDVIFWFTSKQLGFKRYHLKSPYTIDNFFSLLIFFLKLHKIINFNIFFLGYNRHMKRFIKDIIDLQFTIGDITRYIPLTYNGCKRKHKRRL